MSQVQKHFDSLAESYDFWKKKNAYYYTSVKEVFRSLIPQGTKILDVGCGTGDILAYLEPKYGVGIDISSKFIEIAKEKYKSRSSLHFSTVTVRELRTKNFDFIILSDVIEHLEDINEMFSDILSIADQKTLVIITMANSSWEPILEIAEKLNLKMPEGPHKRLNDDQLISALKKNHFELISFGSRLIFPINLGKISTFINQIYYKVPIFKNWGVIHFFVCQKVKNHTL